MVVSDCVLEFEADPFFLEPAYPQVHSETPQLSE